MMADLEEVDVLPAAAAQGGHVAAGVEGGGVPAHGVRAPAQGHQLVAVLSQIFKIDKIHSVFEKCSNNNY